MFTNLPIILLLAGVAILTTSLIMRTWRQQQRAAKRTAERRAAALAAKEAERKRRAMAGDLPMVTSPSGSSVAPERVPLGEPFDAVFTAGATPRSIAKWETEIHQIGRQMVGQLDSKSAVLQTLILEANRAANRLEILIDTLETLLKNSTLQRSTEVSHDSSEAPNLVPRESTTEAAALADVLTELENEIDQFHEKVEESMPTAIILKAEKTVPTPSAPTSGTGTEATFSVESQPVPATSDDDRQQGLPIASLFEDNLVKWPGESKSALNRLSVPLYETPLIEQSIHPKPISESILDNRLVDQLGAPLDKRRQVEMLTDYGYTPKQIAQDLDLTIGEVELMISLRN